jgi:hypothetical protein
MQEPSHSTAETTANNTTMSDIFYTNIKRHTKYTRAGDKGHVVGSRNLTFFMLAERVLKASRALSDQWKTLIVRNSPKPEPSKILN